MLFKPLSLIASLPTFLGYASAQIVFRDTQTIKQEITRTNFDGQTTDQKVLAGRLPFGRHAVFYTDSSATTDALYEISFQFRLDEGYLENAAGTEFFQIRKRL